MRTRSIYAIVLATAAVPAACNDAAENQKGAPASVADAGATPDGRDAASVVTATGFALKPFTPPSATPPAGTVLVTASGEALATEGFAFPPAVGQELAFVDGWDVRFDRLLITLEGATVAEAPDTDPADPSRVGVVVAEALGPWAVDLARTGPGTVAAKGGEGVALPLAVIANQNKKGGAAFEPTSRYAFGFRTVPATKEAYGVNLDAAALADYEAAVAEGCTALYVGRAQWKGAAAGVACTPAAGANAALDALPTEVNFRLCFKAPSEYLNCQNPDNDPAAPLGSEEHQRGLVFKAGTFVTAQATIHTDHPFWLSVEEDSPPVFAPIAAAARSSDGGVPVVTMRDLEAIDYGSRKNAAGAPLPWRNCVGSAFTPPAGNMALRSGAAQNVGPTGSPTTGLRHLADYLTFNLSTQGHLNADGLCYVKRNYPSPN